jgi:hypothetical protein
LIVTAFDVPNNAPGFPPESAYIIARTDCDPAPAPKPDTYPDTFVTLTAAGAENRDTSFTSAVAPSTNVPGVVVPNVPVPPGGDTVTVTGELVALAPTLSVTRNLTEYVPADEYVNDGFCTVESSNAPSPSKSHAYEIV